MAWTFGVLVVGLVNPLGSRKENTGAHRRPPCPTLNLVFLVIGKAGCAKAFSQKKKCQERLVLTQEKEFLADGDSWCKVKGPCRNFREHIR